MKVFLKIISYCTLLAGFVYLYFFLTDSPKEKSDLIMGISAIILGCALVWGIRFSHKGQNK